ncbi:MAG: hypothetical protein EOS23_31195 [Mesorhizobium sp.]|nr:MAG: hypothetical protein EOS23_31195 [Mesorhizobium sp.]
MRVPPGQESHEDRCPSVAPKLVEHMGCGNKKARSDHDATSQNGGPILVQTRYGYERIAGFVQRPQWTYAVLGREFDCRPGKFQVRECRIVRRNEDGVGQATSL